MKVLWTILKAILSYFFGKAAGDAEGLVALILGLISLVGAILVVVDIVNILNGTYEWQF